MAGLPGLSRLRALAALGRSSDEVETDGPRGADRVFISEGLLYENVTEFSLEAGDHVVFDRYEMLSFEDILARMHPEGADTLIQFDDGGWLRLGRVAPEDLSEDHFTCLGGPVCVMAGTRIATARGAVEAEHLCEGDLLRTRDNGLQPVQRLSIQTREHVGTDDPNRPVQITCAALGRGLPRRNLLVSPRQRLLIRHPQSGEEILIAAGNLVERAGIARISGRIKAQYVNISCTDHQLILAEGTPVDTLLPRLTPTAAQSTASSRPVRRIFLRDPAFHADRIDPRCRDWSPPGTDVA